MNRIVDALLLPITIVAWIFTFGAVFGAAGSLCELIHTFMTMGKS